MGCSQSYVTNIKHIHCWPWVRNTLFWGHRIIILVFLSPRPPSLYTRKGAGRWKHENNNKNSGKRLCINRILLCGLYIFIGYMNCLMLWYRDTVEYSGLIWICRIRHCVINPYTAEPGYRQNYGDHVLTTNASLLLCNELSAAIKLSDLTHWGRVTHVCLSKLTVVVSDNGLSPGRRQAIIGTNVGLLSIGPSGTNFRENLIDPYFHSRKSIWKCHHEIGGHFVSASMCLYLS